MVRPRLPEIFHSSPKPLDVAELLAASEPWFANAGLPPSLVQDIRQINANRTFACAVKVGLSCFLPTSGFIPIGLKKV